MIYDLEIRKAKSYLHDFWKRLLVKLILQCGLSRLSLPHIIITEVIFIHVEDALMIVLLHELPLGLLLLLIFTRGPESEDEEHKFRF